ncbi:MAG: M48 family metalloprotease [Candidatus Omnitrophica bacterium]|nr:M48 family metalloprotease [Candidatus Omnitrophota bacterium]MBI2174871.1 M48 family metalloprotease [Candidatus Omnitrophota bacterium]MBI3009505.1 M48 family metalloprotease [Candidatus Omnitrophota bacterium]
MNPICRNLLLAFLLLPGGCVRSNFNLATQREEFTLTSTEREVEAGRVIARRVEEDLGLVADESLQRRVREIGDKLAAVCDRRELVYSFGVVSDEEVNAFSLPGGYVFVNEGLVKKASSDDELAGVIAHEIAHITARHAVKRYESGIGMQLLQLATLVGRQSTVAKGLSVAAQAAQLAYARQDELEADRLAVKYLRAAGFNAAAMLTFLEKLHGLDRKKLRYLPRHIVRPQYALTHPFVPERVRAVKEALFGVADYIDYLNSPD